MSYRDIDGREVDGNGRELGIPLTAPTDLQQQLDAANRQIEKLSAWKKQATAVLSGIAAAMDAGMTDADQPRYLGRGSDYVIADLWDRVRSGEAAERKLTTVMRTAHEGIENIAAQARLYLDHVGIPEHQKQWVRNEIKNEERIALAQIEQPQESNGE